MSLFGSSLLGFLLAVAILVTVHEFGHYLAARICGVRVLRFSVGFGPVLVRWMGRRSIFRDTEFAVSAIPLGGYVRMLDTRDPETPALDAAARAAAFDQQVLWKRSFIVAAGPLANFLLAAWLYAFAFSLPEKGLLPVIAPPAVDSPAAQAGLRGGERLMEIAGREVQHWGDVRWQLLNRMFDETIEIVVDDGGLERRFQLRREAGKLSDEASTRRRLEGWGLEFDQPPILGMVREGGPADRAGLRPGDRILAIEGQKVRQWAEVARSIRAAPERALSLRIERGSQTLELSVRPRSDTVDGQVVGRIDVGVASPLAEGSQSVITIERGLGEALWVGSVRAWDATRLTVRLLWGMLNGEVSLRQISGPLTVAEGAGTTLKQGITPFILFLAIVSVSIGVLNLLPVPMLDGGQLLYHLIEAVKGSPLSERAEIIGQRIGIGFLSALTVLALYNDFLRIFS